MIPYHRYPFVNNQPYYNQFPPGDPYSENSYYTPPVMPFYQDAEYRNIPDSYYGENTQGSSPSLIAVAPPPILSNNPAVATITLFKELDGYPNYGNPSGNADILYTGNRGVWTFEVPPALFATGRFRAQLVIRGVLDDHYNVPIRRYSARITVNGTVVHNGPVPLRHGSPSGGIFTNWESLTFNVPNLRRNNRIQIVNTSSTGDNDWIALDWMEMRILPTR